MLRKLLVCSVFLAGFTALEAQKYEFSVNGSYLRLNEKELGSIDIEDPEDTDTTLKGEYGYGARITLNTPGYYGHELSYSQSRAKMRTVIRSVVSGSTVSEIREDRVMVQQLSYNFLIYFMPAGERWRPFVTGGLMGVQYGAPNFSEWPGGGARTYGGNYGAGIKVRLFPHTLFRLDFRDNFAGRPYDLNFQDVTTAGGISRYMEGSAGFSITF